MTMNDLTLEHWLAILSIAVNVVGFTLIVLQVQQQARAIRGDTYTNLCGLSFEIVNYLAQRPQLYKYFYQRAEFKADDEYWVETRLCCEMIANYCENNLMQREGIPRQVWESWVRFVQQQLSTSVVLQEYLDEYRDWYSPALVKLADKVSGKDRTAR